MDGLNSPGVHEEEYAKEEVIVSAIDPKVWMLELERVAPMLKSSAQEIDHKEVWSDCHVPHAFLFSLQISFFFVVLIAGGSLLTVADSLCFSLAVADSFRADQSRTRQDWQGSP